MKQVDYGRLGTFNQQSLRDSINSTLREVREALISRHETISVAESVTSGQLQAILASAPDATLFYEGGITTYNARQKVQHLGIDPVSALKHNCVSDGIAEEMALGVSKMFKTTWSIGVTGYATPLPSAGIKTLFAFIAISYNGKIVASKRLDTPESDPELAKAYYVGSIIDALSHCLKLPADAVHAS